jgi:hypothetical protein
MSVSDLVWGLGATGVAFLVAHRASRSARAPVATNYRGRTIPLVLGTALAAGYGLSTLGRGIGYLLRGSPTHAVGVDTLWLLVSMGIVFAAGLYDDRQTRGVHGIRAHVGELARGRVTSGIIKVVAALVASAVVVVSAGVRGVTLVVAIVLIAGMTNLVNVLDVAPGRALKFGFCLAVVLLVARATGLAWATLGQTAVLLPLDVRERAMLGDAGANLLGFVVGYLLFVRLSAGGMAIALVVVVVLNALAETVTLTRVIRAVPPLRWADDLWRLSASDPTMN